MSEETTSGNENDDTSPKALRDALEKANKRLAEFEKREQEAVAEKRKNSLTEILKAKGLKESAATHYAGEVSEDAVVQWATEIGLISTDDAKDKNAEAAQRAAAVSGSSSSQLGGGPSSNGPIVADPHKVLELMNTPGFTYEDGVRLGIFPKDPNTV